VDSSLPGVARWELHPATDRLDLVIEGKDANDGLALALAVAFPDGTLQIGDKLDLAVVFAPSKDPSQNLDVVLGALRRDIGAPALQTDSLSIQRALLSEGSTPLVTGCGPLVCQTPGFFALVGTAACTVGSAVGIGTGWLAPAAAPVLYTCGAAFIADVAAVMIRCPGGTPAGTIFYGNHGTTGGCMQPPCFGAPKPGRECGR
jgi:hypothetical protein